jgi:hypothetical protein
VVPVVRASSARSGVCWHRQLHRFLSLLIQRGVDRGSHSRTQLACSTCEDVSNQCRATSSLHQAQPRERRIRHWSRGAVRTTFRRFGALHVSLPVNRGYTPGNRRDGRRERTASTDEGNSNQCGATSYSFKAQSCTQRVWHRSKGTVRTTYRHSFAFHASLPVNCGYDPCAQAYQQAERGEWAKAEESLLEGLRRLAPLSRWVPTLVTQVEQCRREVEQCRRDVSGLTLAGESERAGMVGSVLLSLQSVGCYVGKT